MTRIPLYYDILYVTRGAPLEVIRAAYKVLSKKYHPDKNPDDPDAAKIMVNINKAHEVLSNPDKRQEYDLSLKEQEQALYASWLQKQKQAMYDLLLKEQARKVAQLQQLPRQKRRTRF